jgi:hypothetical protein
VSNGTVSGNPSPAPNRIVTKVSECLRKPITLLLAAFFWLHAIFFLNPHLPFISNIAGLLRLTGSEVFLFILLLTFSMVTASGFWKTFLSLAYIYIFPFVLLMYACYACFVALRAINRWIIRQMTPREGQVSVPILHECSTSPAAMTGVGGRTSQAGRKPRTREIALILLRPFRRFTFLWCLLLLVTTHVGILWLSLAIVLLHAFRVLKVAWFSGPWLEKVGHGLRKNVMETIDRLDAIRGDFAPTRELRQLWNQVRIQENVVAFLSNRYLVSSWAWLLAVVFLTAVYIYIAGLFSFVYYGIARVSGISYRWPDAFVTSVFIPFFAGDLPKVVWIRALGGLQGAIVISVGIGTVVTYLRRRLDSVLTSAVAISGRFAEQSIRERYVLLEKRFGTTSTNVPSTQLGSGETGAQS